MVKIFKRRYPKDVSAPKFVSRSPIDEGGRIKNQGLVRKILNRLYSICQLVAYIPRGLYSVLCDGYFFGGPLAGGIGISAEEIERDLNDPEWFPENKDKKEES